MYRYKPPQYFYSRKEWETMTNYFEVVTESDSKLAKRLNRSYIPNEAGIKELSELADLLECDNDINIITRNNMYAVLSFAYMLGRDAGTKAEKKKQKELSKAV